MYRLYLINIFKKSIAKFYGRCIIILTEPEKYWPVRREYTASRLGGGGATVAVTQPRISIESSNSLSNKGIPAIMSTATVPDLRTYSDRAFCFSHENIRRFFLRGETR